MSPVSEIQAADLSMLCCDTLEETGKVNVQGGSRKPNG